MLKLMYQNNDRVHIHIDYEKSSDVTNFADYLCDSLQMDVDELRFNHKTKTAVIIGSKDRKFTCEDILLSEYQEFIRKSDTK
jgi:hypothetical protein